MVRRSVCRMHGQPVGLASIDRGRARSAQTNHPHRSLCLVEPWGSNGTAVVRSRTPIECRTQRGVCGPGRGGKVPEQQGAVKLWNPGFSSPVVGLVGAIEAVVFRPLWIDWVGGARRGLDSRASVIRAGFPRAPLGPGKGGLYNRIGMTTARQSSSFVAVICAGERSFCRPRRTSLACSEPSASRR
jgi:hypothetical protein